MVKKNEDDEWLKTKRRREMAAEWQSCRFSDREASVPAAAQCSGHDRGQRLYHGFLGVAAREFLRLVVSLSTEYHEGMTL